MIASNVDKLFFIDYGTLDKYPDGDWLVVLTSGFMCSFEFIKKQYIIKQHEKISQLGFKPRWISLDFLYIRAKATSLQIGS